MEQLINSVWQAAELFGGVALLIGLALAVSIGYTALMALNIEAKKWLEATRRSKDAQLATLFPKGSVQQQFALELLQSIMGHFDDPSDAMIAWIQQTAKAKFNITITPTAAADFGRELKHELFKLFDGEAN